MSGDYAFYIEDYSTELKQHINLSENAWLVIDEDIKNFYENKEKESKSGFLNRIFRNFYQRAEASIPLRRIEKKEELAKLYASEEFSSLSKETIALFIDKYVQVYEAELREKVNSYPNGRGEKFRVNKENLDILRDVLRDMEADTYQGSIGKYLKPIYEEYVTKPAYLREQIFFNDVIDKIHSAISRQMKLKIALNEQISAIGDKKYTGKYYLSPYRIVTDKTNTFNYVIGYSEKIIEKIQTDEHGNTRRTSYALEKQPACFRISRIAKIDIQVSMGAKISQEHAAELEKMLVKRGVMFMTSAPSNIKIKFTPKGLESFKRQLYMRPQFYTVDPRDKYLYTFQCTELQAINYFFKFGWDAFIVEPKSLSEQFRLRYERALKTYQGMDKGEILSSESPSGE